MYLNKVQLYGNLTRDPEHKVLEQAGTSVASFSLAINRQWKDKAGEKKEQTEFVNVVAFGKQADVIADWVKKGHAMYVEGRLATRTWEKDGEKKYKTEVVLESFQFGPKPKGKDEATEEVTEEKETKTVTKKKLGAMDAFPVPSAEDVLESEGIDIKNIPF